MSENIPHSLGGFRGAFESEHGRKPTEREIWNAAISSWRDLTRQKSDAVKEQVVEDLLIYAGDNGYSHIDYADTMRHAAALLQSTALPEQSDSDDLIKALADVRDLFPIPERGSKLEHTWMEAVAFPESVPAYVRACIAALPVGELTDEQIDLIGFREVSDGPYPVLKATVPYGREIKPMLSNFAHAILAAARSQPTTENPL